MNSDRRSAIDQNELIEWNALRQEWRISKDEVVKCGVSGAQRFAEGKRRGGDCENI